MAVLLHQLIQLKRGTAYDLSNIDPMLAEGEVIVELDSGKFKIGDGVKRWSELSYFRTTVADVIGLQQALAGKQNVGPYVLTNDPRLTDDRPPLSHTHTIANVVNLQANLDGKQPVGNYVDAADPRLVDARAPKPHEHLISDVSGLAEELATKPTLVAGVVPLALLPVDQFPSSASDVITVTAFSNLPPAGETEKLYVTTGDGKLYYWGGASYVEITAAVDAASTDDVSEGAANLYFTTPRAAAAAPVQSVAGKTGGVVLTKADVELSAVDNTSDANKPISSATQAALNDKAALNHSHALSAITDVGTAAARNVPVDGDALSSEVVLGSDTRLTDSRQPIAHKSTHAVGGNDELTAADVGAADINHTHSVAQIIGLSAVAVSGAYADLLGAPSSSGAQVNTDWNATTGIAQILNKPALSTVATTGAYSDLANRPLLSAVATSGSYADLSNRPTIPEAQVNTDWNATTGIAQILNKPALSTVATTGAYLDLINKPALSNVATTGSYLDLVDIPASYTLPIASAALLGGVKAGSGVSIAADGTISVASANGGSLSVASATELGGIKIGGGLSIDADGVLSVASTSGGTVSQVSVATANGISGAVATATSTPVITLTLGAITPSSVTTTALTVSGVAYPTTRGLNGQVLTTNGNNTASWTTLAAVATSGSYVDLANKPTIPAAQVRSDWTAVSGVAQILNKPNFAPVAITGAYGDLAGLPSFATVATSGSYLDLSNRPTIPAAQVNADWSAVSGVTQIFNKPAFAAVATSGNYGDLTGRPVFATVATTGAYTDLTNRPAFATVATTGAYSDLSGRPTIPAAQVNTDWNATTGVAQILNKPALSAVATSGAYLDLTGRPALSTVASTGSYLDLANRPAIPAAQVSADWTAISGVAQILNKPNFAAVATTGAYSDLSGRPVLASVANTGSYNDLLNRPTVPTAATTAPADDSTAAAVGTSTTYARSDHQHRLPTPAAIGAATATHQHTISDVVNLQLSLDSKQAAGTYATLVSGVVPASQLPTYVYTSTASFPATGETGKFYTVSTNNRVYRWNGATYVEWLSGAANTDGLPEGATNLYFTDARVANAAPVKTVAGKVGAVALVKADVGLSNVDNTTDLNKPVSTATQTALDAKAPLASPLFTGNVGIGTTSPTQRLHVAGNIIATTTFAAFDSSARSYSREWIEFPNFTGLRSANNSAQLYPNDGTYGSWKINGARNGYTGIEFGDSNTSVAQAIDGNTSGFYNNAAGWQFYWSNGELRCAKNPNGGGTNAIVLDSVNYLNYITTTITAPGGRLTLSSDTPVAFTDVTSSTLYYTPHISSYIALYDTTAARWVLHEFSQVSLNVSGLAGGINYDVFIRAVTPSGFALETLAWTSDTARQANSLTLTPRRVYVRTSDNSQRYVGTIRTSAAGIVADTNSLRYVWNMDNRVSRVARAGNNTQHTYAGANGVFRPWRNLTATTALGLSRVQFITGMAEEYVRTDWYGSMSSGGGAGVSPALDSRSAPVGLLYTGSPTDHHLAAGASVTWNPVLGYHFIEMLQGTATGATGTFFNQSFTADILG